MNIILFLFAFILFFGLTPKVFVSLPPKSSIIHTALVHGVIFSLVFTIGWNLIQKNTHSIFEGLDNPPPSNHLCDITLKKSTPEYKNLIDTINSKPIDDIFSMLISDKYKNIIESIMEQKMYNDFNTPANKKIAVKIIDKVLDKNIQTCKK
jgi:hypothetical protein